MILQQTTHLLYMFSVAACRCVRRFGSGSICPDTRQYKVYFPAADVPFGVARRRRRGLIIAAAAAAAASSPAKRRTSCDLAAYVTRHIVMPSPSPSPSESFFTYSHIHTRLHAQTSASVHKINEK